MIGPKDKPEKKGEEEKKKSRTSIKSLSDRISQAPIYKSNNNRPIDRRRAVIDWTRVIDHTKLGKRALRDAPLSVTHGTSSNVKKKTCKTIKKGGKNVSIFASYSVSSAFQPNAGVRVGPTINTASYREYQSRRRRGEREEKKRCENNTISGTILTLFSFLIFPPSYS